MSSWNGKASDAPVREIQDVGGACASSYRLFRLRLMLVDLTPIIAVQLESFYVT
jgi:hypothetical protein